MESKTRLTVVTVVILAVLLVALWGLTYYLFGPLRSMRLGLIDDHEVLSWLGPKGSITVLDVPRILSTQTEVGGWGHTLRFRPVYYVLRVLEAVWHGRNAGQWYLVRIALLAVTVGGFAALAFRVVLTSRSRARLAAAGLVAGATLVVFLTLPAWADIVTRLGPSENYVASGVAIFAWGCYLVWRSRDGATGWILAAAGVIVAVGSKEDGTILLPVFALLYLFRFPATRTRWTAAVCGAVSVLFSAYVVLGFLPAVLSGGSDAYGNSRSIADFVKAMVGNPYPAAAFAAFVVVLACEVAAARAAPQTGSATRRRLSQLVEVRPRTLVTIACLFVVLADLFFYQNYVSAGVFVDARYGLLTEMATAAALILAAISVLDLMLTRVLSPFRAIAVLVLLVVIPPLNPEVITGLRTYPKLSAAVAASSNTTYREIMAGVADLKAHPNSQVRIVLHQTTDYEPIVGLMTYLSVYANTHVVYLEDDLSAHATAADVSVAALLKRVAAQGGYKQDGWHVAPASGYNPALRTACFYFGGAPVGAKSCTTVHQITY